jgi:moderate conductance mechanosensitive channel
MSPSPSVIMAADDLSAAAAGLFTQEWWQEHAETLITKPLRILLIVVLAALVRFMVNRGIRRLTTRTATGEVPSILRPWRRRGRPADPVGVETIAARRSQRAEAIGSVLRSFASFVILGIAVVLVLGELGVNLAPIIASAGVIGVALGFGAQNLVKDFIAGIGIILEDQYGVGDVVDLGEASGTVEAVGLRITRLRDAHGVVWYARNGEILRVGNKSQGFAQVVIDMPVAHDTDLERCRTVMQEVADEMYGEEEWAGVMLAEPESLGAESLTAAGVTMRVQVRTTNADQWRVARELRQRLTERFVAEGFKAPAPVLAGAPAGQAVP